MRFFVYQPLLLLTVIALSVLGCTTRAGMYIGHEFEHIDSLSNAGFSESQLRALSSDENTAKSRFFRRVADLLGSDGVNRWNSQFPHCVRKAQSPNSMFARLHLYNHSL